MDNYIEKIELDINKLDKEINDWSQLLDERINGVEEKTTGQKIGHAFLLIFLTLTILGIIIYIAVVKSKRGNAVADLINENGGNVFERWLENSLGHSSFDQRFNFRNSPSDLVNIIEQYKYRPYATPIGVNQTYNIMNGKIFDHPFDLSCGVYHSQHVQEDRNGNRKVTNYYQYMPVLQIKTQKFTDLELWIKNSNEFGKYPKNKIKFDNIYFQKKYQIMCNKDMEMMMIFSALIQEKWMEKSYETPPFQMIMKNGVITILFKSDNFDPFMDLRTVNSKSMSLNAFLKNAKAISTRDLVYLTRIFELIFCITFFQWEKYDFNLQ